MWEKNLKHINLGIYCPALCCEWFDDGIAKGLCPVDTTRSPEIAGLPFSQD